RSLRTTVDAKARLVVGSDARAEVGPGTPPPQGFPLPTTEVSFVPDAGNFVPGGENFDLLAIDPATFARGAYWNGNLSDVPLPEILRGLSSGGDSRLPVAVVASQTPSNLELNIEGATVNASVIATPSGFPGMVAGVPLVVVDSHTLVGSLGGVANPLIEIPGATTELWVKGPTFQASSSLAAAGFGQDSITTAAQVEDLPQIAAVIQSLEVLRV